MLNIFKKKSVLLFAPVNGKMIPIEEVSDEVFRSKMMGDGVAFILEDDTICAPCDGKVSMIPTTLHAFGMTTKNQTEILIHIGLDTVDLQGAGFEKLVDQGSDVKQGTPILKVDLEFMQRKGIDLTTPMVVTNSSERHVELRCAFGDISRDQIVIDCTKK